MCVSGYGGNVRTYNNESLHCHWYIRGTAEEARQMLIASGINIFGGEEDGLPPSNKYGSQIKQSQF